MRKGPAEGLGQRLSRLEMCVGSLLPEAEEGENMNFLTEETEKAINDVLAERARQRKLTFDGVSCDEFDKENSQNDWVAYITSYAGRASQEVKRNEEEGQEFRECMVKVAALAIAAVEAYDKGYCPGAATG